MAMSIWKYPLEVSGVQNVRMKKGAKILSVHTQHGKVCVWALVNEKAKEDFEQEFRIFGTGHPIPVETTTKEEIAKAVDLRLYEFVGTCLLSEGELVLHVFIRKPGTQLKR